MFPFHQTLTGDPTIIFYEDSVERISSFLGSKDASLTDGLIKAGRKYRRGQDRITYENAVRQLIDNGRTRSPIQYEVMAQLIRLKSVPVMHAQTNDFPLLHYDRPADMDIRGVLDGLTEWRSFVTGTVPKTTRIDCFVGANYVLNRTMPAGIRAIESLSERSVRDELIGVHDVTPGQMDAAMERLLPLYVKAYEAGKDLLVVSGGVVPRRLKLRDWMKRTGSRLN